jgi:hypothetical protein
LTDWLQGEEGRSAPGRAGDGSGDCRQAGIGLSLPDIAVGFDRDGVAPAWLQRFVDSAAIAAEIERVRSLFGGALRRSAQTAIISHRSSTDFPRNHSNKSASTFVSAIIPTRGTRSGQTRPGAPAAAYLLRLQASVRAHRAEDRLILILPAGRHPSSPRRGLPSPLGRPRWVVVLRGDRDGPLRRGGYPADDRRVRQPVRLRRVQGADVRGQHVEQHGIASGLLGGFGAAPLDAAAARPRSALTWSRRASGRS